MTESKGIKLYSDKAISSFKNTTMLDKNDLNTMQKLSTELERVYHVKQLFRTPTEMKYSVLNDTDCPTPASKYWQAIREQDGMFNNLIYLSFDYEETVANLEIAEAELHLMPSTTRKDLALIAKKKVEIKRHKFSILDLEMQAKDRVREIDLWEKIKKNKKLRQTLTLKMLTHIKWNHIELDGQGNQN